MTTHTVANPEYDPAEARKQEKLREAEATKESADISDNSSTPPTTPPPAYSTHAPPVPPKPTQTTAKVLEDTAAPAMPGVSTHLSAADKDVTLDIRWTVLCDLFLVLIADSVYDARSRVLLESVALKLGLGWLDVVKFERRVTDALEIQEGVEQLEQQSSIQEAQKNLKKRRYMMLGLATLGMCVEQWGNKSYLPAHATSRRGSCHRSISWSSSSCHRGWSRCRLRHYRYFWNDRIPRGYWWCCGHHHRWCLDRFWYCCSWNGKKNTIRSYIRYPSAT